MGRKIDLKKIEDVTKCQVTFSKRRSSLIKKANEIAVCCDVDVALVAFSPSGRVSKYCNKERIEDVLTRYVNLPPESRHINIENVKEKLDKLKALSYMDNDDSKLHYLDNRIENLQLQIKKRSLELQILETNMRDYEVPPEQEPASLHQLSWCERNLNHSLEKVIARKMELENKKGLPKSSNINVNERASATQNGQAADTGSKVHGSSSQDLVDHIHIAAPNMNHVGPSHMYNFPLLDSSKYANIAAPNMNHAGPSYVYNFPLRESSKYANTAASNVNHARPSHMYNFTLPDCSTMPKYGYKNMTWGDQIPFQQPSMVDPLLKLPDQINADTWNNFSSVSNPNAAHISTQTSCDFQTPRFTSTTVVTHNACSAEMPQSLYNEITETSSQFPTSNFNQFNMEGGVTMDELFMNFGDNLGNPNASDGGIDVGSFGRVNSSQMQQIHAPPESLQAEKDFCWDTTIDVSLNGIIDVDRSGGTNSIRMQASSKSLQPENDFCWDTALNEIIDVYRSGGMDSTQMQQMQAPSESLQPENDFCWDTALKRIIDVDKSGGMNSSQMQQMEAPSEHILPENDVCQDTLFDNVHKEAVEQNTQWNDSWDWIDLPFADNFQSGESSKQ